MARQLWLLRHAEAEPHGTRPDPQRRLTRAVSTRRALPAVAIQSLAVAFDEVLVSPKARAQGRPSSRPRAGASSSARSCASIRRWREGSTCPRRSTHWPRVPAQDGRLLLVGHEPDLSLIVGGLTGGRIDLKKGGLAVVRLEGSSAPATGGGELVILMRPRELALIAGGVGGPNPPGLTRA